MERRGFLGLLAALGLVRLPKPDAGCADGPLCGMCDGATYTNITEELRRAYPADRIARSVEESYSPFYRALKGRGTRVG